MKINNIKIGNINNGDVLSGELCVIALPGKNYRVNESYAAELEIDDEGFGATSVQPQEDGSWALAFSLPTNCYSNGPHTLRVFDRWGDEDTRHVEFSNTIHQIHALPGFDVGPNAADDMPHDAHIMAAVSPPQPWRVEIRGYEATVRVFSGDGDRIDVTWDGTDAEGNMAEADNYLLIYTTPADGAAFISGVGMYRP